MFCVVYLAKARLPPDWTERYLSGLLRKCRSVGNRGTAERGPEKVERGRRWGSAKAERGHR